jgi:hypothetical protein
VLKQLGRQEKLEKKYNLVENMLLGDIDPRKTEDPREAVRAICRRNLNSVVVISIGPRMTQKVVREFKVSFRSSARRQAFFNWLDSAADMWLEAARK